MIRCPICFETDSEEPYGGIRLCRRCFHGWRYPLIGTRDYNVLATSQPYGRERAESQLGFLAPMLFSGVRIFEIGCGSGSLAGWIKRRVARVTYHGLEPSPDAFDASSSLDRVWRVWPDEASRQASYHLAIASHVLEHLEDPAGCLKKLLALLSDDGAVFLEVPNGSGHPCLPFDTNPGHLHFFSAHSLTMLLSSCGLRIEAMTTGAFESARYPDAIRVLAKPFQIPCVCGDELAKPLALHKGEKVVVWGAGGMARELVVPFVPASLIQCFLDRAAQPEQLLMGLPVYTPNHLSEMRDVVLLISSVDHEADIRREVEAHYAYAVSRIISLSEVLNLNLRRQMIADAP